MNAGSNADARSFAINLSFDEVFKTHSFLGENNRKCKKILQCVDFFLLVVEDMGIFHVFQLSFDGEG